MNQTKPMTLLEGMFSSLEQDGIYSLSEAQVYDFLAEADFRVPISRVMDKKLSDSEFLHELPGDRVVVKVVSPYISHKTELQAVLDVEKRPQVVRGVALEMLSNVPTRYADFLTKRPELMPGRYKGLAYDDLVRAISDDIRGVLVSEYIRHGQGFDSELFVGLRRTREFGPVISAGIGGVDTELFAKKFRDQEAVITGSAMLTTPTEFFDRFRRTTCYSIISGQVRGHERLVRDDRIIKVLELFFAVAHRFSGYDRDTRYCVEEFEVNPFALTNGQAIPVDGLMKFSTRSIRMQKRPQSKVEALLRPKSVAVVGASATKMNVGRMILANLRSSGFDPEQTRVIRPGCDTLDGIRCVESFDALDIRVDLAIIAIGAKGVPGVFQDIVRSKKASGVIIVPGGMGEKSSGKPIEEAVVRMIEDARKESPDDAPVVLGGNCLGIVSKPASIDTLFIPDIKLPKQHGVRQNIAFISQSGAYMITRMNRLEYLETVYDVSTGNQIDISISDLLRVVGDDPQVDVIAIYVEGFRDMDGLVVAESTRDLRKKGKEVVVYKAGRTAEGKTATSGHTASIAGNYDVAVTILRAAGAYVADTFTDFVDYLATASSLHGKDVTGMKIGAVSNAGYETVGMADSVSGHGYQLELAGFSESTVQQLQAVLEDCGLQDLVTVRNPLDLTPMADDHVYELALSAIMQDPQVDFVVVGLVPFTTALKTLPEGVDPLDSVEAEDSIARRLVKLAREYPKPMAAVVDAGRLYDPLARGLKRNGVLVFRSADRAVLSLGRYMQNRLRTIPEN